MKKILFLILLAGLLIAGYYLVQSMQGDFYLLEVDLPEVAGFISDKIPVRIQQPYPPPETETPTLVITEPPYPPPVTDTPTVTSTATATQTSTATLTNTLVPATVTSTSTRTVSPATSTSTTTSTATGIMSPATSTTTATTTATGTITPDPGFTPTATVPRPRPGGPGNQTIIILGGLLITTTGLGGLFLIWVFARRDRRVR